MPNTRIGKTMLVQVTCQWVYKIGSCVSIILHRTVVRKKGYRTAVYGITATLSSMYQMAGSLVSTWERHVALPRFSRQRLSRLMTTHKLLRAHSKIFRAVLSISRFTAQGGMGWCRDLESFVQTKANDGKARARRGCYLHTPPGSRDR
jgi:hypothetical protein